MQRPSIGLMRDHQASHIHHRLGHAHFQVLFVCTGNICRSPLAEAMASTRFDAGHYVFSSAGTRAISGAAPTEEAQIVAAERGLDIAGHEATPLDQCELPDAVIGMEQHHLIAAVERFPRLDVGRIRLLDHPVAIADPLGNGLDAYRAVATRIDRALATIDWSGFR